MKLTLKMTLAFSASLVLVLALSLTFLFVQTTGQVTRTITAKTEVLVKTFEAELYTGAGKEGPDGWNEAFVQSISHIQQAMPNLVEINLYRIDTGKVAASSDPSVRGKTVDPEDLKAAQDDKSVVIFGSEEGKRILDVTAPLHRDGRIDYVMGVKNDVTVDFDEVNNLILWSLGLGLVGAIIGIFLVYLTARSVAGPLIATARVFQAMAVGDLTGRLPEKGTTNNEVSNAARDFNAFADHLGREVNRLQEVSNRSRGLGNTLAQNAHRVDSGVEAIRGTLTQLKSQLETLNRGVQSPEFSLGDIQSFLQTLLGDLEDQSESVDRSRHTTSEMVKSLKVISEETREKLALTDELAALGRQGDSQMQATVQSIRTVAKITGGVTEFIQVIHDVADQTNLLAMNASIEAAHAGTAGRGFAVVAGEIRKLAAATSTNAKNISASLELILGEVTKAVDETAATGQTIHRLTLGVDNLSQSMSAVKESIGALADETTMVTQAFDHLRGLTDGVLERTGTMGGRIVKLEGAMADLVDVANRNAQGFGAITAELDELIVESGHLAAVIRDNGANVAVLEEVTQGFRTRQD